MLIKTQVQYKFEEVQLLKFMMVDVDNASVHDVSRHDHIGSVELTLADLVTAAGSTTERHLFHPKHKQSRGRVTLIAEELKDLQATVEMTISCKNLARMDMGGLGKSGASVCAVVVLTRVVQIRM
jgi:hypothetical protein